VKQSRGITFVSNELIADEEWTNGEACQSCQFNPERMPPKFGLQWVGAKFYPSPGEFLSEARAQGISKRIGQIPKGIKLGETIVLLAHPKVTIKRPELGDDPLACEGPAIFAAYVPTSIEYVVRGDETDEELEALEARGATLVQVERSETRPFEFE
jgi:hypothetical protein